MEQLMNAGELFAELRRMWTERDPEPGDLASRVLFRIEIDELDDLDAELMAIQDLAVSGARATEVSRTVMFIAERITVMVTSSPGDRTGQRLDGWIAPAAALDVDLHGGSQFRSTRADEDGRFVFDDLVPGPVRLVVQPTVGAAVVLDRPMLTPAIDFSD
jgi:hypothetical protein